MKIEEFSEQDTIKHNLYLRSIRQPASRFKWDNPLYADGIPILARSPVSKADPNVKMAYDNLSLIANTRAGYLAGNIQRRYGDDIEKSVKDKYTEFDRVNNFFPLLKNMMVSCSTWGVTYSLCYIDVLGKVRIREINAWNCKVKYDDFTNEPLTAYVYYKEKDKTIIKEYDKLNVTTYEQKGEQKTAISTIPHGFTEIPVIEWINNQQKAGNGEKAISLLDAYDRLMSDNVTEWATFRNAYLMLKNIGIVDEEKAENFQKTGMIPVDGEKGEIKFITKDVNPAFCEFVEKNTWSGIWIVSSTVDPKAIASLTNATAFQIGQMYRQMEQDCKNTEVSWNISLEYLDRVLKSYWTGLDIKPLPDYSTYDIDYIFERDRPKDILSDLKAIKEAGGNLPQKEIIMRSLGIDEKTAVDMVELAQGESVEML